MAPVYGNILLTGTTCTGKSTLAKELAQCTEMEWIDINSLALQENLFKTVDNKVQSSIIDDHKVIKFLRPKIKLGGNIIECQSSNLFARHNWFCAVFVPRTDLSILYDRLEHKGHAGSSMKNNIESELFEVLLVEAYKSFRPKIIYEIYNNTEEDIAKNVEFIISILHKKKPFHG
uniref:Putative nucleotide kinase/nuclear protein involved oxidative stress response n=1 Tax=Panstrongylus lignarius TaxID=156445 RepID=A0A224XM33_9HEMI